MPKTYVYNTRQRTDIENIVKASNGVHLTAEEIAERLKESGCSVGKTTVYRSLEKLCDEGKVRKFIPQSGKSACFQYIESTPECHEHFHLKCVSCGELIHMECDHLSDVSAHIAEHHGFKVDTLQTVLYGKCKACSEL